MLVLFSVSISATITNVQAEVLGTNATVYWQADTTLSTYYDVALVDGTTYGFFCEGSWPKEAFVVEGANYLTMTSDLLLNYGFNYTDLDTEDELESSLIPSWKTGWETNVDTLASGDFTLKVGTYIFTVTGYSATFTQTEEMSYTVFVIEDASQAIDVVKNSTIPTKMIDPVTRQIYIVKDNQMFTIMGNKVK